MWYCRLSLCAIYLLKFWQSQQCIRYFCHWQFILVFAVHIAACNILALKAVCLCISATSLCSPASRCKCGSPCIYLVLKVLVCVIFGLFKFVLLCLFRSHIKTKAAVWTKQAELDCTILELIICVDLTTSSPYFPSCVENREKNGRVKSWRRETLLFVCFSPPGFHAAIFFRGFLSRHARRTKRKRDYL